MARSSRPQAAVDLPLPLPVWTMSRPFSTVLAATSASWTALRLAILALWRAFSSEADDMAAEWAARHPPARQLTGLRRGSYQGDDGAPHGDQKGTRFRNRRLPPQLESASRWREHHWETGKVAQVDDPRAGKPAVATP